jgi:adenosylhomocysteine nucleosidase
MKLLTVFPLQEELDFFLQGCLDTGLAAEASMLGRLPVMYLPSLGLALAQGGLGKVQFGVQTQHLIDSWPGWDVVICAGAAGALDDRLIVGDVVVGTETVEYDIYNKFGRPRMPRFTGAEAVINDFRQMTRVDNSFKVYFGAIASGDEDIVEAGRRDEVRARTGALAASWEGAGGARASYFSTVPFVEIRGISDEATTTAAQDFEMNLPRTMRNVASVVTTWAQQRQTISIG